MKLSEQNTPILRYLNWHAPLMQHPDNQSQDKLSMLTLREEDVKNEEDKQKIEYIFSEFGKNWEGYRELFTKRIDCVSMPFYEMMHTSTERFDGSQIAKELTGNEYSGTLFLYNGRIAICYRIKVIDSENINFILLVHNKNGICNIAVTDKEYFISNKFREVGEKDQKDDDDILRDFWGEILTFYFYLKYAKVEVYESIQKKPIKISKHEKFLVDSPLKINWVDSSWFRTIIRKEEFGVRGHFRLQNYKEEGQWVKRLIYIEPYIKHGFVRHAKIEKNR